MKLSVVIPVILLLAFGLCYAAMPSLRDFLKEAFEVLTSNDEQRIRSWVSRFRMAGPVVLVLVMIVQMFLFVVPNIFLMMVAIVSYGPVWGSVISLLGVFASSSVGYMIGRYLGPVTVNKLVSERSQRKATNFIQTYGVPAIAITRLSSLSNDSLSIVAGLLKMSYKSYILATLSGITPLILVLAIFGRSRIVNALAWIAGASLIILAIYIFIDKRKKAREAAGKKLPPSQG